MELQTLEATSDDKLNDTITYHPLSPDGDTTDLKFTIMSARNDSIDEKVQHLTERAQRLTKQMKTANGERYAKLKAKRSACEKEMSVLLLVSFEGLTENGEPVESSPESIEMLCSHYWIRESILDKSTELSSFLGK